MKSMQDAKAELAAMMAAYAAASATATASYEAECNLPPTAEDLAEDEIRRENNRLAQAAKALVVADNLAAIAALDLLGTLTLDEVKSLPHMASEFVDCECPKYSAVVESYLAHRNPSSNQQSLVEWVAVVTVSRLTLAQVKSLRNNKPTTNQPTNKPRQ